MNEIMPPWRNMDRLGDYHPNWNKAEKTTTTWYHVHEESIYDANELNTETDSQTADL